jgi:phosphoserine phosphatase
MISQPGPDQSHVLILIGAPGKQAASSAAVSAAIAGMTGAGAPPHMVRWLERGTACDLPFRGPAPADLSAKVRTRLSPHKLDIAVLPESGRRKALLVADMDSTILTVECLDELADFAGQKARIAAITERAMRGELPFEEALAERVGLLTGLEAAALERTWAERIRFTPGAAELIATMKAHGARTVLVSGGFTFFTERTARTLGFDRQYANSLELAGGALTGRVLPPILGRDAKRRILLEERAAGGLASGDTLAVGDGANDLGMLAEAGLGVAYRAKPAVAEAAQVSINHGDLTALLFLQGYKKAEFVAPAENRPRTTSGGG